MMQDFDIKETEEGNYKVENTESTHEGVVSSKHTYRSVWDRDINLVVFYEMYQAATLQLVTPEFVEIPEGKRSKYHKIVIGKHKKALKRHLGLEGIPKPRKMIVRRTQPLDFHVRKVWETSKRFKTKEGDFFLKKDCVPYTEEKEKLIDKFNRVKREMQMKLDEIHEEIMDMKGGKYDSYE